MKKAMIARFVMGAAAIFAVGCSAETGQTPEGVGATAEALTVTAASDALSTAEKESASCTIQDGNNKKYSLIASGIDATSAVSNKVFLYDPSAAAGSRVIAFTGATTITSARTGARMITDPGNAHACLTVGGQNGSGTPIANGNTTRSVLRLVLSGTPGSLVLTESDQSTGFTPIYKATVAVCDTTIIAIGGSTATGEIADVQYWKGVGNGWGTISTVLSTARQDFEIATAGDGSHTKFMVSGGLNSGAALQSVEAFKLSKTTNACDTLSSQNNLGNVLANKRDGAVAFESVYTAAAGGNPEKSEFTIAGGTNITTTTYSTSDKVTVRWDTLAQVGSTAAGPALASAVHHPGFVLTSAGLPVLAGGSNQAGTAQTIAQKYDSGTVAFVNATAGTFTARIFPQLAEGASGNVLAAGGDNAGAVTTVQVMTTP